jgi:plastocyanin
VHRIRVLCALAGALALGLLASSCAMGGNVPYQATAKEAAVRPHAPVGAVVYIDFDSFAPKTVTIRAGQAVEWVWLNPGTPHNVVSSDFASPVMTAGPYFHVFRRPGVYRYRSTLHYDMTGVVVVEGQPA